MSFFGQVSEVLENSGMSQMLGDITGTITGTTAQNAANRQMAQEQMQFQERMSDTSHQREVNDLKKAGLNPILSANAGASSPPGATAQMSAADSTGLITSAMDGLRLNNDIKKMQSDIDLNGAMSAAQKAAAAKDTTTAMNTAKETELLERTMRNLIKASDYQGGQADFDKKMLNYDNIQRRLKNGLDTVNSGASLLKPSIRLQTKPQEPPKGSYQAPLPRM